jgi:hypothetical protein
MKEPRCRICGHSWVEHPGNAGCLHWHFRMDRGTVREEDKIYCACRRFEPLMKGQPS